MSSPNANSLPQLALLASRRAQPVTVFDLETTTNIPYVKWMGITEVGRLTIFPDGRVEEESSLVNPERSIPPKVRELTGIQNEDVRNKPTWDVWKEKFHQIAAEHLVVGYNCQSFDCVVVARQNERYGLAGTTFENVLDAMAIPGIQGKLADVALAWGISARLYHRAMADVWTTAQLVEAVAARDGLETVEGAIGKKPSLGGGNSSPRKERETQLAEFYKEHGTLPDLDAFGEKHGIKKTTVEGDVLRLIEAGVLPSSALDNQAVQEWLAERLDLAIAECWVGDAVGRLKPLFERFASDAPAGFDYTQLRLALRKRNGRPSPE